jgi:hypothetical protein
VTRQWNAFPLPAPVHAPVAQPAQFAHWAPVGHCESFVHQHGTSAAWQVSVGDVAVLQLPIGQENPAAVDTAVTQFWLSTGSAPVQVPEHWFVALTHFLLEQFESATQRHADLSALRTGAGVRVVVHAVPPLPAHAIELGAVSQPCPSLGFDDLPVQLELLQMQCPLAHAASELHLHVG